MKTVSGASTSNTKPKLTQKRKIKLTRKWVLNKINNKDSYPLSLNIFLMGYIKFCSETKMVPLDPSEFVKIVKLQYQKSIKDTDSGKRTLESTDGCNIETNREESSGKESQPTTTKDTVCGEVSGSSGVSKKGLEDESDDSGFESQDPELDIISVNGNDNVDDHSNERGPTSQALLDFINEDLNDEDKNSREIIFKVKDEPTTCVDDCELDSYNEVQVMEIASENDECQASSTMKKTECDIDCQVNNSAKCNFNGKSSKLLKIILENIKKLVSNKKYAQSPCYKDAKKLCFLMVEMMKKQQMDILLDVFVHCFACKERHGSLCFMFKRIIHHIYTNKGHDCVLKQVYGYILRLHLDTCTRKNCTFPKCNSLREQRKENKDEQE